MTMGIKLGPGQVFSVSKFKRAVAASYGASSDGVDISSVRHTVSVTYTLSSTISEAVARESIAKALGVTVDSVQVALELGDSGMVHAAVIVEANSARLAAELSTKALDVTAVAEALNDNGPVTQLTMKLAPSQHVEMMTKVTSVTGAHFAAPTLGQLSHISSQLGGEVSVTGVSQEQAQTVSTTTMEISLAEDGRAQKHQEDEETQAGIIYGIIAGVIFFCICGFACRRVHLKIKQKLRPKNQSGSISITIAGIAGHATFAVKHPLGEAYARMSDEQDSSDNQPTGEPSTDGKIHVVWDADQALVEALRDTTWEHNSAPHDIHLDVWDGAIAEEGSRNVAPEQTCAQPSLVPAFRDGKDVEYYSSSHKRWIRAVVTNIIERPDRLSDKLESAFQYEVMVNRSGAKRIFELDRLRAPWEEGELVEILTSPDRRKWLPGSIDRQPGSHAATLGYQVRLDSSGEVIKNVQAEQIRQRFPAGLMVLVYRGPLTGWRRAQVHEQASDGLEAEPVKVIGFTTEGQAEAVPRRERADSLVSSALIWLPSSMKERAPSQASLALMSLPSSAQERTHLRAGLTFASQPSEMDRDSTSTLGVDRTPGVMVPLVGDRGQPELVPSYLLRVPKPDRKSVV